MPYASTSDLPEAVRARYSSRCQAVFLKAFNKAAGNGATEASAFKVAHTAAGMCKDAGKAGTDEEAPMTGSANTKASTNDTRLALEEALKAAFGSSCYVQDFDPDAGWVIYQRFGENLPASAIGYFRVGFDVGTDGAVTLSSGAPAPVEQRTTYVPRRSTAESGVATMAPAKAAELDADELDAWFAGKVPRRLLAIPFGGPIPTPDGKGRDIDVEYFDEQTDIKPDWFTDRPVDWHHSKDPTGRMNGVLIGKASRLGTFDGTEGEPDEDGWWVDLWLKAGESRLALVRKLVERGGQLFGSSYAYPNLVKRGKAGHIDVWPYMLQTISPSPQNTLSVLRPAKAVLDAFDHADIAVSDRVLRQMLAAIDDLRDLPATAANGRLTPARDLPRRAAKAGRELSGRNLAELDEWAEVLDSISRRIDDLRGRVRTRYSRPTEPEVTET